MTSRIITVTYDPIHNIQLDAHIPLTTNTKDGEVKSLPAVVAFHGGGLVAGSKDDAYFPKDLAAKFLSQNVIFISPNYRLLYPSTGVDILQDIHTLFDYLSLPSSELTHQLAQHGIALDRGKIGVIGFSGGNCPAKLAAFLPTINPFTRPKVYFDLYGMAGDFLLDHWVSIKPENQYVPDIPFFEDKVQTILNNPKYRTEKWGLSEAHLGANGDEEGRMGLFVWFINQGNILDYLLDEPGLSARLREVPYDRRSALLSDEQRRILGILPTTLGGGSAPPTIIVHGENDRVVPIEESFRLYDDLKEIEGGKVEKIWVKDAGHGLFVDGDWPRFIDGIDGIMEKGVEFVMRELNGA
ncbi:hypothetical protein I302_108722 [Kwoniella bestiolae CBS 10118]|uniref:Alpha/beta hydrolase fold-3 domain-containing protein n=1 Tax=Kwoniella bestiolae CBS 10118 TaxID=1296100 RepID=A0A1B9FTW6_9TREE|nr:hypothetical protein I302_07859 [Kwoniella bestiolae CBS 10118]OCF22214.1 hypothetical protein I302_07859 [Kwoniella bestiolae CBS 10118]